MTDSRINKRNGQISLARINDFDTVESNTTDNLVNSDTIAIGTNPYGTPYQGLLRDNEG